MKSDTINNILLYLHGCDQLSFHRTNREKETISIEKSLGYDAECCSIIYFNYINNSQINIILQLSLCTDFGFSYPENYWRVILHNKQMIHYKLPKEVFIRLVDGPDVQNILREYFVKRTLITFLEEHIEAI